MKLMNIYIGFFLALFIFSCSSKPVDFYPSRKNQQQRQTYIEKKQSDFSQKNSPSNSYIQTNSSSALKNEAVSSSPEITTPADPIVGLSNPNIKKVEAEDIILNQLSTSQLELVLKEVKLLAYKPLVYWQLGQLYQKNKFQRQALEYYQALANEFPQHHLTIQASSMMTLLQASQDVDSRVIGAILPLTGKNANVGQHALNALNIALGVDKPNAKFKVAVYDTQSLPDMAASGVDKLITDDKVIAIIGGLSSKEATLVAQRAELLSVPFVALSQKSGLTNIGEYIFRNSLTPEMQVDQLVSFAIEKLNAKRFAILYPNDSYGVEFSNIYWDHVLARGGQMTAAQTYDPKENDFTGVIQKMVGTYYPEARPEEYKERLEELIKNKQERAKKNKDKHVVKNTREHEIEESVLQPVVDFDVLFLPDSGKILGQVMAFMKVSDVSNLTYLGTNIWNSPDIVKRASGQKENIYFVDALDPNDTSVRETDFFKEYYATYNEEPTLIEMQTYESAKMIRDQIVNGGTSRETLAKKLRFVGHSSGITGELRMSRLREIERPVHVLSLDNGLIRKIN